MNRVFLPLHIILLSFIVFFSPINEMALTTFFQQQWEKDVTADYQGFYVILERLFDYIPQHEWDQTVINASKNTNVPLKILPVSDIHLTPEQINALKKGKIVVANVEDDILYKQLKQTDWVIRSGPMHTQAEIELGNLISAFSTFLIFFSLILIWAVSLQHKMAKLNQANLAFSQGDYSVRASERWYHRVGALNHSFNHMAAQIEKQIQSQKELTNAVAHELRTPIACLRFELEQLIEDTINPEQQTCIDDMAEDIDKMDELVDELLTYARFDHQGLPAQLETLNFSAWLKSVVEQSKHPNHIKVSFVNNPYHFQLTFEPHFMERAINNLIINGTRYAQNQVQISIERVGNDNIHIYIDDDGPGIPEAARQDLFSPFVRADKSRAKKTGGFGLGLAIVYKIIQWHKGTIMIEDSPLGGARLCIVLKITA